MTESTVNLRIGVCSWSLRPSSPSELASSLERLGLSACQLALVPVVEEPDVWGDAIDTLHDRGVRIPSGMLAMEGEDYSTLQTIRATGGVAPDQTWPTNRERANKVAEVAARHRIPLVTFHAGFLPHDESSPRRSAMIERLRELARIFALHGVEVAFETGQETAPTLRGVLREIGLPGLGVNFDPANMILYGMGDPVESLRMLADNVVQVHIKDATPTEVPGTWGTETPVGEGAVDWGAFFAAAMSLPREVDFIIEREGGDDRETDIAKARDIVQRLLS